MSLRALGLLTLPLLQLADAIGFPSPAPTVSVSSRPPPLAPQPTPGISLRKWGIMRRQDDYVTSAYWWSDEPNLCGWGGATLDKAHKITCGASYTCKTHASNTNYPNLIGCCTGDDCYFNTVCYNSRQVSATPSLTESQKAFSLYCTQASSASCVTYIYSDISVTNYGCASETDRIDAYTSAFDDNVSGTTISRWDQFLTAVDDDIVSSYEGAFATTTKSQAGVGASSLAGSSGSPHATETSSNAGGSSSSRKSSTPTGAIAGGVVGGVVGGAAIALAGVFLLRKKKKNQQAGAGGGTNDQGGAYQSVPGNNSGHSTSSAVEMQPPAEMESSDPSHRMAEAQGSTPADRAFEIQDDTKIEMEADTKLQSDSKGFVAELPAGDNHHPRP